MKIQTLAVLAGVSAPLILGGSALAGFIGIETTSKPNEFGIFTVNVYAVFDRPGEDHMLATFGTHEIPLTIEVTGGTFYNSPFGSDVAPQAALVEVFPSLAYDTFVTIGKKDANGDNLIVVAGFPGFDGSVLETLSGWLVFEDDPQGNPFDPANSFPGDGSVLIGQFSTADGNGISGTIPMEYISNGFTEQSVVTFHHALDAPCPWDCADGDGKVGVVDFLALLVDWGLVTPCDFDGGGIGNTDFLELLFNWGPCP